jgi:hypothetical protein
MGGLLWATIYLASSFVFYFENPKFLFPSLARDPQMIYLNSTSMILYSSFHHSKEGWPYPSIGFVKLCVPFCMCSSFYSILYPRSFPSFSLGFWKNHRVLVLWLLLGNNLG